MWPSTVHLRKDTFPRTRLKYVKVLCKSCSLSQRPFYNVLKICVTCFSSTSCLSFPTPTDKKSCFKKSENIVCVEDKRQLPFVQTQTKDNFLSSRLRWKTASFRQDSDERQLPFVQTLTASFRLDFNKIQHSTFCPEEKTQNQLTPKQQLKIPFVRIWVFSKGTRSSYIASP